MDSFAEILTPSHACEDNKHSYSVNSEQFVISIFFSRSDFKAHLYDLPGHATLWSTFCKVTFPTFFPNGITYAQ